MKTLTTLDSERRAVLPPAFRPHEVVEQEWNGATAVTYQLAIDSIPLVTSHDWHGKRMGAQVRLNPEVIASAIRADRDAR